MKLLIRLNLFLIVVLTASSSAIGYFAIERYQADQISRLDQSLASKVAALSARGQDPLTTVQYLAQVSAIPLTAAYLTNTNNFVILTDLGTDFEQTPTTEQIVAALARPQNVTGDLRIRSLDLPDGEYILLAESTADIKLSIRTLAKQLIGFILAVDLIGIFIAFIFFRNDNELSELNRKLNVQQLVMEEFMGDASHELRTPLTVIKGYVELAKRSSSLEESSNFLAKTDGEMLRMESLIRDILRLAELGDLQIKPNSSVNYSALVTAEIEKLSAIQPQRNLSSEVSPDVLVKGDQEALTQVLTNIFSNIRTHTPIEAPVHVLLQKELGHALLIVEDGGPGIPGVQNEIRPFQRFDKSRSRETGGSGLGLSIIKRALDQHGGEISLGKSALGGLHIEIRLPR